MKKILLILAIGFAQIVMAQEAQVKKTVETFFAGLNSADVAKIKSVCSDKLILQSVELHTAANKFTEQTADAFYKMIAETASKVKFEEKVMDYKILTDGTIAHVWVPYEFFIEGQLSHKGVNSFELVKFKEGWKVVYIIDTRGVN